MQTVTLATFSYPPRTNTPGRVIWQINDKFDEQQQEKKAYYEEMNNSLLNIHCGVDDSHVDYVNVWKRQYDAAKDRCVLPMLETCMTSARSLWVSLGAPPP